LSKIYIDGLGRQTKFDGKHDIMIYTSSVIVNHNSLRVLPYITFYYLIIVSSLVSIIISNGIWHWLVATRRTLMTTKYACPIDVIGIYLGGPLEVCCCCANT
ncbi:hypothetical protein ACJX0J_024828, partial [Zea mays]